MIALFPTPASTLAHATCAETGISAHVTCAEPLQNQITSDTCASRMFRVELDSVLMVYWREWVI